MNEKKSKIFIKLDFFKNKKVVHNQKYNVMAIYIFYLEMPSFLWLVVVLVFFSSFSFLS